METSCLIFVSPDKGLQAPVGLGKRGAKMTGKMFWSFFLCKPQPQPTLDTGKFPAPAHEGPTWSSLNPFLLAPLVTRKQTSKGREGSVGGCAEPLGPPSALHGTEPLALQSPSRERMGRHSARAAQARRLLDSNVART